MQSCGIDTGSEPRGTFDFLKDFDEIAEVLSSGCLEGLEPPAHSYPVAACQAGRQSPSDQSAVATSSPIDLPLTLETNGTRKAQRSAEANRAHQKKFRQRHKVHLELRQAFDLDWPCGFRTQDSTCLGCVEQEKFQRLQCDVAQ